VEKHDPVHHPVLASYLTAHRQVQVHSHKKTVHPYHVSLHDRTYTSSLPKHGGNGTEKENLLLVLLVAALLLLGSRSGTLTLDATGTGATVRRGECKVDVLMDVRVSDVWREEMGRDEEMARGKLVDEEREGASDHGMAKYHSHHS